ncbi:MAG: hypothetical protein K9I85_03015 [Saprospiraceae bacterium]|nr:hypothetical protein [Saprospiraceae bacterium]
MIRTFQLLLSFMLFALLMPVDAISQVPDFSDDPTKFVGELDAFLKQADRKELKDLFKDFEKRVKAGIISPEILLLIREQSVQMREIGMTPSPYFESYLISLEAMYQAGIQERRIREWMTVYTDELNSIEKRKFKPVQNFLDFSQNFFADNALRYSKSGITWLVDPKKGSFSRDTSGLVLIFEEAVDLVATRKQDSILITGTTGRYYPSTNTWIGKGGMVDWDRFEHPEIQCALADYTIDFTQGVYTVEQAELTYPLLFGTRKISGRFNDKLVVRNAAVEGSYPKFESYDRVVEIPDIGGGVRFKGGFRMEGTSIYGFAGENEKALITLDDGHGKLSFKATADVFTLKREELVTGSRVETTLYFGPDSFYHQSVDFRYEIDRRIMRLTRANRASDQAPFYSSMHGFDFAVDQINWYLDRDTIKLGERSVGFTKGRDEMSVISEDFFDESDFRKIQNVAHTNPLNVFKAYMDEMGSTTFQASELARLINPDFTVENIQTLLFDLVQRGFIFYDVASGEVEIKPKLNHYVLASRNKEDYDFLNVISTTRDDNGIFSLKDSIMTVNGVPYVQFSRPQRVAVIPLNEQVRIGRNRSMAFSGKMFAGSTVIKGTDMKFDYPSFGIGIDTIRTFDLYIPTGKVDAEGQEVALAIGSRIENFSGTLQVDAPKNKSGIADIPLFPALQSKEHAYVYYDAPEVQGGVYLRDSFYFQMDRFTFNSLDRFVGEDLQFKGRLVSDSIFPVIEETAILMPDSSLGFVTQSPDEGWGTYVGRGKFTGELSMSNQGLLGKGLIQYLRAKAFSEDVVFKPQQMIGSAREFDITEDREGPIFMPKVEGSNVLINWLPYRDSMYVTTQDKAFDFYPDATHTLAGTLILTPDGLRGRGTFDWDKGFMESKLFAFGAHDVDSDTLDLKIRALGADDLAFDTRNINGNADFDIQQGKFRANSEELNTVMPYNKYQTSMNEFEWDMKEETITFKTDPGKMADFLCIDPVQDSLTFQGKTAFYDLRSNLLQIGGVPQIFVADAWIYPDSGLVEVRPGGVITTLKNARIVADTSNQYHVINRATIDIKGKRHYEGSGFYEYNVGPHKQEIAFERITGYPVKKGEFSKKKAITRAEGDITDSLHFYIDTKTRFKGTIILEADAPELTFKGFAFLEADKLNRKNWFSIDSKGDKNNLMIAYDEPRDLNGEICRTGFFINRATSILYPNVMSMTFLRKDRPILETKGYFRYDKTGDTYYFGDSSKVSNVGRRGNLLVFNNRSAAVNGEGKLTLGSGLDLVKIEAAGTLATIFNVPDSLTYGDAGPPKTFLEVMAGLQMIIPQDLMKEMVKDLSASFDATYIDYVSDPFYQNTLAEFIPDDAKYFEVTNIMRTRALDLPEEFDKYTFFLPKVSLRWDPDLQSFVSVGDKLGMASVQGEMMNRYWNGHLEIRMPSNGDDRLYLYLKSSANYFYFFGYRGGIMSIASNNPAFQDAAAGLKAKELVLEPEKDKIYEIQFVDADTAERWLRRIQDLNK